MKDLNQKMSIQKLREVRQRLMIALQIHRLTNVFVNRDDLIYFIKAYDKLRYTLKYEKTKAPESYSDLLIKYMALVIMQEGKSHLRVKLEGLPFFVEEKDLKLLKEFEEKSLEFIRKTPDAQIRI